MEIIESQSIFSPEKLICLNTLLEHLDLNLAMQGDVLQLQTPQRGFKPLFIDFVAGENRHRRLFGGGRKQPLAKAIGIKKAFAPTVFDLTAGLGKDAFVLATLGCRVCLYERSPIIAALLENALFRARHAPEIASIMCRLELFQGDSLHYLKNLGEENFPEVVYMDPMFPHRDKSALVKKEMRIFRELVGDDTDSVELLVLARQCATKRVTVKRPKGAPYLGDIEPSMSIHSPKTRYDVYLSQ